MEEVHGWLNSPGGSDFSRTPQEGRALVFCRDMSWGRAPLNANSRRCCLVCVKNGCDLLYLESSLPLLQTTETPLYPGEEHDRDEEPVVYVCDVSISGI